MSNQTLPEDSDLQKAREKYRLERDKRLKGAARGDVAIVGDLRKYLSDSFTTPVAREPLFDEVEVAIIGAGFAGLLAASQFKKAGFRSIRLIDRAGDVGGVWYWNRYPEAKCDVESLIYMPLLEETGYVPTQRYAAAPEIWEHARRIARHYDLYKDAVFQTTVSDLVWDEALESWHVHTDRGDDILAQFVVSCNGPFSEIKLPNIAGIENFGGKAFHTSRWDYDYTGGAPGNSKLDKLADKRVGFIGTGATALQCIGPLGRSSRSFYLFQRTPSTVGVRDNGPIEVETVRTWEPGWQKKRQENFTTIVSGFPTDEDFVRDGWTKLYRQLNSSTRYAGLTGKDLALEKERVDFEEMEQIRRRVDSIVKDPAVAEKLKPYYAYMCKRAGWHDEYLDTFNLPQVTLVDTEGQGVERITERGLMVNGREYELDCLIFGTGFETETAGRLKMGFEISGMGGVTLSEKWANGLSTLHGMTTSGFPNLFLVPGINAQAVVTVNVIHMTQEYVEHMAYIAKSVRDRRARYFDVTPSAEADWVQTILDLRTDNSAFLEACTPGRRNLEGNAQGRPDQNTVYGGGPMKFFALLKAWREAGKLEGLDLAGRTEKSGAQFIA